MPPKNGRGTRTRGKSASAATARKDRQSPKTGGTESAAAGTEESFSAVTAARDKASAAWNGVKSFFAKAGTAVLGYWRKEGETFRFVCLLAGVGIFTVLLLSQKNQIDSLEVEIAQLQQVAAVTENIRVEFNKLVQQVNR